MSNFVSAAIFEHSSVSDLHKQIHMHMHPTNSVMFPLNHSKDTHLARNREHFKVNKCHTEKYKKSTIPNLQVKLNSHMESIKK